MADDCVFDGKMEADILLSFKGNKGHRARYFNKITNLLALQEQKYSVFTEKTLQNSVKEMEKFTDRLLLLANYLSIHGLQSAPAHVTEAENLRKATEEQADKVINDANSRTPNRGPCRRWSSRMGKPSSPRSLGKAHNGPQTRQANI